VIPDAGRRTVRQGWYWQRVFTIPATWVFSKKNNKKTLMYPDAKFEIFGCNMSAQKLGLQQASRDPQSQTWLRYRKMRRCGQIKDICYFSPAAVSEKCTDGRRLARLRLG
jgi:hypothetical protein